MAKANPLFRSLRDIAGQSAQAEPGIEQPESAPKTQSRASAQSTNGVAHPDPTRSCPSPAEEQHGTTQVPKNAEANPGHHRMPHPDLEIDPSGWMGKAEDEEDVEGRKLVEEENRRTRALVRDGDVRPLLEELIDVDPMFAGIGLQHSDLAEAVRNRSKQDLPGLVNDSLAEAESCISLAVLRTSEIVQKRLARAAKGNGSHDNWLPRDIQESGLPFLIELSRQLAELEQIRAATARQWKLANERKSPTPRKTRAKGSPRGPKAATRKSPRSRQENHRA